MVKPDRMTARPTRWMHRLHARLSGFARPATGFVSQPEPRTIGSFARGRQLVAGNFLFAGHLVESSDRQLWDIEAPDLAYAEELHGFGWLDDLAAVADMKTRERAQDWLWEWIARFGAGKGEGWIPDLTGRRIIRWIHHALFVLRGVDKDQSDAFYRSLSRQTIFLSRRWHTCSPGLPRFEALTGLIYAGLSLEGMARHVEPAVKALAKDCASQVDGQGGIPTRNPEELLEVFTLLTWAAAALSEAGRPIPPEHQAAIERIAPTLRTLRHADGGLARFHGGGRGAEGRLDTALAASGVKGRAPDGLAMGYARLSAGRSSVVVDAGPPPAGKASYNAHASTLAFELTSGRRPVIVNCGSGAIFGAKWRRAGRATPSHSTLCLDGLSSARLGARSKSDLLVDLPTDVPIEVSQAPDGTRFEGAHDGYVKSYGLTHARTLEMTFDGRAMAGEELLVALNTKAKRRFDKRPQTVALQGIPYQIRFHLHPEVDATVDMGGASISLALKSGELWLFRHEGVAQMTLEPSVYLEKGRLRPRATKQIVLSGRAMDYATRIRWSLAKAQDTPISIRDLNRDDPDLT
ncbi:heparinase II/III family protein [Thalassobius sp. S69A]|uniref:heparinase II/III family protein n=1 Tax=unclassified Thalassovita TaxID=2619711 RepID=UPI000C1002BE|nr:heparinase [Paracoccaceae bacterium]MBT27231.1 heparinase [Paracoccaceae bacterium]